VGLNEQSRVFCILKDLDQLFEADDSAIGKDISGRRVRKLGGQGNGSSEATDWEEDGTKEFEKYIQIGGVSTLRRVQEAVEPRNLLANRGRWVDEGGKTIIGLVFSLSVCTGFQW